MKGRQRTKTFHICHVFHRPELVIVPSTPGKEVAAGVTGALLFSPFEKRHFHKARNHSAYDYIFLQSQFCLLTGKNLSANKVPVAFFFFLLALIKAFEHLLNTIEADH